MIYVYILFSQKDKKLYIGRTPDLRRRLGKHSNGFVKATKYRRPVRLIYYEVFLSEKDAKQRELYLKGGKGHEELKIMLSDTYKLVGYNY